MVADAFAPEDVFALNVLAPALRRFQPPTGAFQPTGAWTACYGVWTVGQRGCARVGSLRLERTPGADGSLLRLHYHKRFPGRAAGETTAEIACRNHPLSTPTWWDVTSRTVAGDGKPVPRTRLRKSARVEGGTLVVRDPSGVRRVALPPAWTVNWALFEAVPRLPREGLEPLHFTLLDDFDQVKPEQRLGPWRRQTVLLGGRPVRLHGVAQTGRGIVPVVYWLDEAGRLLFVVAGIEAYIHEEPAEGAGR